jgi:hypothetical protein
MDSRTFKIGDKVVLRKHTSLWAQEHVQDRSDLVYRVTGTVEDSFERITVQRDGAACPAWIGIPADLFEKWGG